MVIDDMIHYSVFLFEFFLEQLKIKKTFVWLILDKRKLEDLIPHSALSFTS